MLTLAVPLPLLIAEIDLSIASNPGFSWVVGAMLISRHSPWWLGMLVGVGIRTLIGFLNGVCMTWSRMVSLIETLAMMIIFQGVLLAITHGNTITDLPNGLFRAGQTTLLGWPLLPLIFVLALVGMVGFLCLTVIGGNPLAAVSVGIRLRRIKILAFTLSGFLSSIAGYLLASWQMAITSNQGSGLLSYAIAAPIIGGVSVS